MTDKKKVSPAKKKTVEELKKLIEGSNTILIASIKNLPGSQFQEIKKKLRGKAIVKVPKKNISLIAIDSLKNEDLSNLKEQIKESTAILFSKLDCFDLASELESIKSPTKAKAGQIAPEDIEIPEGPTDLVPGPAISELGALGIKIQIDKGKILIKEPKVIAKKGEKISQGACDIMNKLGIKPFTIGFVSLAAFDAKDKKIYLNIKINREEAINNIKEAYGKALPFAVAIAYVSKETIGFLLAKANSHAKVLENLTPSEITQESNNTQSETTEGENN
jgi:large subunit ribosomal protein L10